MNGLTRNLLGTASSIAMLVLVAFALKWMIDPVLGSGATVIIMIFISGIVVAGTLVMLGMNMTNATHRSAGEDMTEFAGGMAKAQAGAFRVHQEYARLDREAAGIEGKKELLDHKEMLRRANAIATAQIEAERNATAAQPEQKTGGGWMGTIFGKDDGVVDVEADAGQFYE